VLIPELELLEVELEELEDELELLDVVEPPPALTVMSELPRL